MSQKKLVCHGALCKCKFGFTPDTLAVLTQQKVYINDHSGSQKLVATNKDIGMPFQAKTFGQCKLQPTSTSYLPCIPSITAWDGFHEKTQIKSNQGAPLLEDSKATCAIAGAPCVEIVFHGQTGSPSVQNLENTDDEIISQVVPILSVKEIKNPSPYHCISVTVQDNGSEEKKGKVKRGILQKLHLK